jgi:LRR receptor-like serine/threonine-protein kinase FLS2
LTSVSTMGDVYNFGVVLMELFTRKQPTDDMFGQEASLCSWVGDAFPTRISLVLDLTLRQELAQIEQDVGIHLMVRLSLACTRHLPKDRPTMIQARDLLMEIKSIELLDEKSGQRRATEYNG